MKKIALGVLLVVSMFSAVAFADSITYTGQQSDEQGTGLGNRLYIMSLQNNGTEQGAVKWDGSANVAVTYPALGAGANDVKQLSQSCGGSGSSASCSIAELAAAGINANNFRLVFQVNQEGSNLNMTLNNVTLYFWSAGGSLLGSISCDGASCPGTYGALGQGSAGYIFSATGLSNYFGNSTNRVSLGFSGGNPLVTNDGADNWYITSVASTPEPASLLLLSSGLLGLGGLIRRKR